MAVATCGGHVDGAVFHSDRGCRGSTPAASTAICASGSGSPSRWPPRGSASTTAPPRPSSRRSSASSYTIAGSPPGPAGNHPLDRGLVQRPPAALVDRLHDPQRKGGRLAYRPSRRITHCPSDGSAPDGCGGLSPFFLPLVP